MESMISQLEEKMLLSSISDLYPDHNLSEGGREKKARRKKAVESGGESARKRRLTDEQARFLEMNFGKERKLESGRKVHLASAIGLDPKQVAVWFQNRRARWKNKHMEEEFLKLKAMHDAVVVEKCHLETEVVRLREKLSETEELRRVSAAAGSPSSSVDTQSHQFLPNMVEEDYYSAMYFDSYVPPEELMWDGMYKSVNF